MVNGARTSCDWSTCWRSREIKLEESRVGTYPEFLCSWWGDPNMEKFCSNGTGTGWFEWNGQTRIIKKFAEQQGYKYCDCEDGYGFFEYKEDMSVGIRGTSTSWIQERVVAYHCNKCPAGRASKYWEKSAWTKPQYDVPA